MVPGLSLTSPAFEDQHVVLRDGNWAFWRWSVLRGAGFSVELPLHLASPVAADAADRLLFAEAARGEAKRAAVAVLNIVRDTDDARRTALTNIVHALHAGKIPIATDLPEEVTTALAALQSAHERLAEAQVVYQAIFDAETITTTGALREVAGTEPFRQALAWQNRSALHTAVMPFLHAPANTTSKQYRKNRLLLAKYLQRYALKNDTIGFFGPVGWARWMPDAAAVMLEPGEKLPAQRTAYLEGWCINALGQHVSRDPAVRIWAKPRLMPFARIDGGTLHLPYMKPMSLSPAQARVLAACNGMHSAHDIARRLMFQGVPGLASANDVYAILTTMHQQRRIVWTFDVPYEDPFPEQALRRHFEAIGDPVARENALAALAQLERGRDAVRDVVNDAAALDRAIGALEATFTTLTEQSATRSAGQMYAGRTLIYEDCRRDGTVALGTDLLHELEGPLSLILTSARWMGEQITRVWRQRGHEIATELAQNSAGSGIEFTHFFPRVTAQLFEDAATLFAPVQVAFQRQWATILGNIEGQRRIQVDSKAIASQVSNAFDAPDPKWPAARYHSPDIMIAASDVGAIDRGDYFLVMGELHLALNTMDGLLFSQQHPCVGDLHAALAADLPDPVVLPIAPVEMLPSTRLQPAMALPKDIRLAISPEACAWPPSQILRMADLVVIDRDGTVMVQTRDGQQRFEALEVISDFLSAMVGDYFALFPALPHTPRVTIDRLVVARESWRMRAAEMDFLAAPDAAEGYLRVRRWAEAHQMPRYLFYRTARERKPCFLDLSSPIYVELFIKETRAAASEISDEERPVVTLSEMLPTPEQTWLVDAAGARYTSEIRIVAVDRRR